MLEFKLGCYRPLGALCIRALVFFTLLPCSRMHLRLASARKFTFISNLDVGRWVGMPYPGGVGGPAAQPIPFHSRLCLASIFLSVREAWIRKYFEKTLAFFGNVRGSPRSSPRGRLGFAEGKAEPTSVFVRIRAPEGSEGSQKINM